ncbi:hypothetical protein LSAT2_007657 [Lamellibrachia satsuma]|nr:hypothetical protein LSAT2_007657 [Lamellibrachia satsuma]
MHLNVLSAPQHDISTVTSLPFESINRNNRERTTIAISSCATAAPARRRRNFPVNCKQHIHPVCSNIA